MDSRAGDDAAPTIVNSTVVRTREYLTGAEVEALMAAARKGSRYGHRDATMILVAYRHGLRASEVCDLQWQQIELSEGRLPASKTALPVCTQSGVMRCERYASYAAITRKMPTYSFPSAAAQSVPSVSIGLSSASGKPLTCHSRSTRTCFAMLVGSSSPTTATTHGLCSTTSATGTSSTPSGTPTWHPTDSRT